MTSAARNRWVIAPLISFVILAIVSIAWLALDRAPLVFDPSAHLFSALYFDAFPGKYLTQEQQYYPPLVHVVFATCLRWTDYNLDVSIGIVALSFLALLLASTYLIGVELASPRVGAIASVLLALFPATYIHSRSLLLDLPLVAVVAATVYVLLRTRGFQDFAWSLAFGGVFAVGLLTKQTFAAALLGPLAFDLARAPKNGTLARNVLLAVVPIVAVLLWWYVPRLDWFLGDYRTIQEEYARSRHDPSSTSLAGFTYYLRGTWHQTTFVFAALWVAMVPWTLRGRGWGLVASWWGGVFVTSSMLVLKDSRFLMPALPAIALMTAMGIDRMRNGLLVLVPCVAFGLLQLWGASFGASWLPEGAVVTNRVERNDEIQIFAQHWRMTAADTSVADRDGWGGAASALAKVPGPTIAIVGDRILYTAARNPRLTGQASGSQLSFEQLTCADASKLSAFDTVVVQLGGRFGVPPAQLATCTAGLHESYRIPIDVPRLLAGTSELIVYERAR